MVAVNSSRTFSIIFGRSHNDAAAATDVVLVRIPHSLTHAHTHSHARVDCGTRRARTARKHVLFQRTRHYAVILTNSHCGPGAHPNKIQFLCPKMQRNLRIIYTTINARKTIVWRAGTGWCIKDATSPLAEPGHVTSIVYYDFDRFSVS